MSRTSEALEPYKYFNKYENDTILPYEHRLRCKHNTVLMTKSDGESILICEVCKEDVTNEIIG